MGHFGAFCPIMGHNGATPFQDVVILHLETEKIGSPKEILDTPKENPITPKVMALSQVNSE